MAGRRPSLETGYKRILPERHSRGLRSRHDRISAVTAPQNIASRMDKPALRRRIRRARQALSRGYRLDAMRAIARHASRLLKRGKRVGAYLAAGSELDLEILMSVALWRGAKCICRRFAARPPAVVQLPGRGGPLVSASALPDRRIRRLGAARRTAGRAVRAAAGHRRRWLPHGAGRRFYDTTLAFRQRARQFGKPLLVGVAYDCQRVERVPREPWDIRLDYLLTESGLRRPPLSPACR